MEEYYEIAFNEEECYTLKQRIEACRNILADGHEAEVRHRLGMLYYECGRYYSAKVELEEAARLDPELREETMLADLSEKVVELERIAPKKIISSAGGYGVDPSYLQGGKVVDVFRINGLRGISVKFEKKAGDESPMFYRYQTFFYNADAAKPSCVVRLEISGLDTCCVTRTDLETMMRANFGAGHEDMAYEEFKYQVVAIMRDMRPPMMTSEPDEPDSNSKEE